MKEVAGIALVSKALANWVHGAINPDSGVGTAEGKLGRPERAGDKDYTYVFLFEVTRNQGYASIDLPTRDRSGRLTSRPVMAVDLHYLICFGTREQMQAHTQMQQVLLAVHAKPGLDRKWLEATVLKLGDGPPEADPPIEEPGASPDEPQPIPEPEDVFSSPVQTQHECVKLSLRHLSIDEISKLWGMFPDVPFMPSICVTATTVILEAGTEPKPTASVQKIDLTAVPFGQPRIESIRAIDRLGGVIHAGDRLVVVGRHLTGEGLSLKTDKGTSLMKVPAEVADGVAWTLPQGLPAGVRALTAERQLEPGGKTKISSETFPFILRPEILGIELVEGQPRKRRIRIKPAPAAGQSVSVVLTGIDDPAVHLTVLPTPDPASEGAPASEDGFWSLDLSDVAEGAYVVRIRVDGAESLLTYDDAAIHKVKEVVQIGDP